MPLPDRSTEQVGPEPGDDDKEYTVLTDSGSLLTLRKRTHVQANSSEPDVKPYKGMGPWLRILCFWLILGPILEAGNLGNAASDLDLPDTARNLLYSNYALCALQALIGLALVKELRSQKNWKTIQLAIVLIWTAWPVSTAVEHLVLPPIFIGQLLPSDAGGLQMAVFSIIISAGLTTAWTAYLLNSERIEATYTRRGE